ncbi:MAG: signal peptide peptidase SppA [Methyloligellaceae bacterium]
MSLEAEALADRRRLQRRLTVWRIGAVVLAIALIAGLVMSSGYIDQTLPGTNQIARVSITGLIQDDRKKLRLLKKIAETDRVKAVLLHINSPGGTTTGGESLFEAIRGVSEKKPVVALFGTIATSAAYIAGLATDRIVSRGNTITGSVGVIFQWAEVSELLGKFGVKVEEIKSGTLKANPSPFKPADEAGLALAQEMVSEAHQWFLDLVAKRRGIDPASIDGLKEGRIYSGRQAHTLKLVDEIGGETVAIKWLESKHGISPKLKIMDWKVTRDTPFSLISGLTNALKIFTGLPMERLIGLTGADQTISGLRLDGLISVWHPAEIRK